MVWCEMLGLGNGNWEQVKLCVCISASVLVKPVKHVQFHFKYILKSTEVRLQDWAESSLYAGVQMAKAEP